MLKDIKFTFQDYSDPDWAHVGAFENNYVPDEIFAPVLAAVKDYAPRILSYEGVLNRAEYHAVVAQKWVWPEVLQCVSDLWQGIDPDGAACLDEAVADAKIKITDVDAGMGGGSCGPDFIDFRRDGTLNDPIYLAHESGHLIANLRTIADEGTFPWNMAEMPAFFMQERAYDVLNATAPDDRARYAVALHRLSEYSNVLARIPFCLWGLDYTKDQETSTLRGRFATWAVRDEGTIWRFENWSGVDDSPLAHKTQMMHAHPFSGLLMVEFYQRFKKAPAERKRDMLAALYDKGARASLVDTLAVFSVHTQHDLGQAARSACGHLADEIERLGFAGALPGPHNRIKGA